MKHLFYLTFINMLLGQWSMKHLFYLTFIKYSHHISGRISIKSTILVVPNSDLLIGGWGSGWGWPACNERTKAQSKAVRVL